METIDELRSSDHFIQRLDLGIEETGERSVVMTAESLVPADVGLLATMVDVIGGSLIIGVRPQATLPTTNIELHGLGHLVQPGPIVADARLVAMSKRRATAEVAIDIAGQRAWAIAGFVVRDDPTRPPIERGPRPARSGRVLTGPLWQEIGVGQVDGGAEVRVEPHLYNNNAALQGGATVALLEAAARTAIGPGDVIAHVTINYYQQVRGDVARARVRFRHGQLVVVDVYGDDVDGICASASFGLAAGASDGDRPG